MDMSHVSDEIEHTSRFTLTGADPIEAPHSDSRRFLPMAVTITVSSSVSTDEPDMYGPTWEATVRGPWLRKDGTVGQQEHAERYWQRHVNVPAWLATLGERCVANALQAGEVPALRN